MNVTCSNCRATQAWDDALPFCGSCGNPLHAPVISGSSGVVPSKSSSNTILIVAGVAATIVLMLVFVIGLVLVFRIYDSKNHPPISTGSTSSSMSQQTTSDNTSSGAGGSTDTQGGGTPLQTPAPDTSSSSAPPLDNSSTTGLIPDSSIRLLTESDLTGRNAKELTLIRNEIYARHGRPFTDSELQQYFSSQPWYQVNYSYSDDCITSIEKTNAEFIMNYQKTNNLVW